MKFTFIQIGIFCFVFSFVLFLEKAYQWTSQDHSKSTKNGWKTLQKTITHELHLVAEVHYHIDIRVVFIIILN